MSRRIVLLLALATVFLVLVVAFPARVAQAQGPGSYCSEEGQRCNFSGTKDVTFGANGQFHTQYGVTGGIDCTNGAFGGDPIPGVHKQCFTNDSAGPTYLQQGSQFPVCNRGDYSVDDQGNATLYIPHYQLQQLINILSGSSDAVDLNKDYVAATLSLPVPEVSIILLSVGVATDYWGNNDNNNCGIIMHLVNTGGYVFSWSEPQAP